MQDTDPGVVENQTPQVKKKFDFTKIFDLNVLATNEPTRFPHWARFYPSAIDIAITKRLNCTAIQTALLLFSDHNPIFVTLQLHNLSKASSTMLFTNWYKF
ncbi:hypothetical protein NPIL_489931 [Nephila pilipes]|uniref:Endonuclease/exonuclease/phosphatase domain-containing protein n=1 Tax=Nephila pilipes TaxID=299642 RepID=A0A8X6PEB2_NEPPI|nr:hypothetical protein NPIL_630431 [Nephila pilipes]GFT66462.1 hypothetical protein NPIL_489931 [Nephila pilipes]